MKKEGFIAYLIIAIIAVIGGFFIYLLGAQAHVYFNIIPVHNGDIGANSSWTHVNCEQGLASGNSYLILKTATSTLISPSLDLSALAEAKLDFKARTYFGVTSSSNMITVSVSIDNGSTWSMLSEIYPLDSNLLQQTTTDLQAYVGKTVIIRLQTLSATGSKGVGLDDISVSGKIANQPPDPDIFEFGSTTLLGTAVDFNAANSTDTDGYIISYAWSFGDGEISAMTTTSHLYPATGTYSAMLVVTDDDNATSGKSIIIDVIDHAVGSSSQAVSTTTAAGNIVINEFLSDPNENDKEWLELYNKTTSSINIDNWTFSDNSSTTTLSGIIGPADSNNYLIIEFNSGKLNNGGDIMTIRDSAGKIIDQVAYGDYNDGNLSDNPPSPDKGFSMARRSDGLNSANDNSDFSLTITPTKGTANVITPKAISSGGGSSYFSRTDSATAATDTASTTTAFILSSTTKIIINEIFPNPAGSDDNDEFIELKNIGSADADLNGWIIGDNTESRFLITKEKMSSTVISSQGFLTVRRQLSKIALNNSGLEIVKLLAPNEVIFEQVSYMGNNIEGQSYSRNTDAKWQWTSIVTPDAENVFSAADTEINSSTEEEIAENKIYPQIYISEILPNPSGADADNEFIELYNPGSRTADLNGYKLADDKNHFDIKNLAIGAFDYLLLYRPVSKLSLNNDKDNLKLYNPAGLLISQVGYQKSFSDLSLALDSRGQYRWTNLITPGRANSFPANLNVVTVKEIATSVKKLKKTNKVETPSLERIREFDNGQKVKVKGIVAVEPGIIGKTVFYLAGSGIQVYCYKKDFPKLKVGDYIELSGELSENSGERRIKIAQGKDIKLLDRRDPPVAHPIANIGIDESLEGSLISVSGEVIESKSRTIYLDNGTEEIKVYLNSSLNPKDINISEGDYLTVTGIVSQTKTGYRLLPRYASDISFAQVKGTSTMAEPASPPMKLSKMEKYLLAIIIFLVCVIGWIIWPKKTKKVPQD